MRRLLLHPRYPRSFQIAITAAAALGAAALLYGPSRAEDNAGILFLWLLWWPLTSLSFLGFGRIWCAVCPTSLLADLASRIPYRRIATPPVLSGREVPVLTASLAIFYLVGLRFDFEEQVGASVMLLLLLASAAVVCTLAFRERLWCRALCPVGALGGLLSRLAPVRIAADLRACTTGCEAGSCDPANGLCPTIDDPRTGLDPRSCILCGNCLKRCPNVFGLQSGPVPPQDDPAQAKPEDAAAGLLLAGIGLDSVLCHARDWPILFWKAASATGIHPGGRVELAVHGALILVPLLTAGLLARAFGPAAHFRERFARFGSIGLSAAAAAVTATALRVLLVLAPRQLEGVPAFQGEFWGNWLSMARRLDGVPVQMAQAAVVIIFLGIAWRRLARANGAGGEKTTPAGRLAETFWFLAITAALLFLFSLPALA